MIPTPPEILERSSGPDLHTRIAGGFPFFPTTFPLTPSRSYTIVELLVGKVGVDILAVEEGENAGVMVGTDGARLVDADGNVLEIAAGSLGQTAPVSTRTVAQNTASALVGSDFTLLRAVEVDLTRQILSAPAVLTIPAPAGFDPALPVVVARPVEVGSVLRLRLVALGRAAGSMIASDGTLSGLSLPGITTSGTYCFLQAKAPLGFLRGIVRGEGGASYAAALVTADSSSLADVTGADGRYLLAAPAGEAAVTAFDPAHRDGGSGSAALSVGTVADLDLTIVPRPPKVLSVSPADGAGGVEPSASVVVTFSEPVDRATVSDQTIALKDAAGTVIPGAFSFSPDGAVVTLYPAAALKSETIHTLTVGSGIRDLQGYPLAQAVTSAFTVRDTTPPPPPAGSITATFPDAEGMITVTATQGSAEPDCTVLVINDTSGEIVSVSPQTNGSFSARISAQLGDEIQIVLMDAAGNQTLVSYLTFKAPDGRYLVTAKGGKVEGEGGSLLEIPAGALVGPAVVKITPVVESDLPHPVPAEGQFLAAVNVDTGGIPFQKMVTISIPAPADMPEGAVPFVARPVIHVNPDGSEEQVYQVVDSAKVEGGQLTSACPPFLGPLLDGLYVFIYPVTHLGGAVIVSGTTYQDMNDIPGYTPGEDKPIEGAVVRCPAADNFISYSDANGHYATYGFTVMDVCRNFAITAIHPQTMFRHTANITTCDAPYEVKNLNFKLADKNTQLPDKNTPPKISMNLKVAPGETAVFAAGTIPVDTGLEMPIFIDEHALDTVTLTVSFKGSDTTAGGPYSVIIDQKEKVALPKEEGETLVMNRYTFTPRFDQPNPNFGPGLPLAGENSVYFRPMTAGTYTFTLTATDISKASNTKTLLVRAVPAGEMPDSKEGRPRVDELLPAAHTRGVAVTAEIVATFSEPVQNVTDQTFKLLDCGEGTESEPSTGCAGSGLPADIVTGFVDGRMRATLIPKQNLLFDHWYKARLTTDITDVKANTAQIYEPPPNSDGLLNLENEVQSLFKTKAPIGYGLIADNFGKGYGIALYTHIDTDGTNRTYAYVTARENGLRVIDVTDPTRPVVVKQMSYTNGGVSWNMRGVAVDRQSGILAVTEDIRHASGGQYGYVRFYDIRTNPAEPKLVGKEKLAEAYSGIPGKVAISGSHAFVSTVMVGLQVVDIDKARADTNISDGSNIVGIFDTLGQGLGQPREIQVLKGGRALMTCGKGDLLVLDIGNPIIPQVMATFKPNDTSVLRIAGAADFGYVGDGGLPLSVDLIVVSGMDGKMYTLDLTDPYNPVLLGTVKDQAGQDLLTWVREMTVSPTAKLVYVSTLSSIQVIDVKDPANPRLLYTISAFPDGNSLPLAVNGLAELNGWVYLASQNAGLQVMDFIQSTYYLLAVSCDEADYPGVKLNCTDYYPALGERIVDILGVDSSGMPMGGGATLRLTSTLPEGITLTGDSGTTANFNQGKARFKLKADPKYTGEINLQFEVVQPGDALEGSMPPKLTASFKSRNNANVTLSEVLRGEAVYTTQTITQADEKFTCDFPGQTTGNTPDKQGFDFVQMMIGHILPPLRIPVDERNLETLVDVYGCYGGQTERALKAIIDGTSNAAEIRSLGSSSPAWGYEIKKTAISHSRQKDGNAVKGTFDKLQKIYPITVTATDIGKIIDKELLVGLVPNDQKPEVQKDKHPTKDADVGIYELYQEDDWDGDGVSNYVEVENSNRITLPDQTDGQGNPKEVVVTQYYEAINNDSKTRTQRPVTISPVLFDPLLTPEEQKKQDAANFAELERRMNAVPRGTHGGPGEIVNGGNLDGLTGAFATGDQVSPGMRIPDFGLGYYYHPSRDPEDTDNYAIPEVLKKVEEVARNWSLDRLVKTELNASRKGFGRAGYLGQRFGISDLSLPGGRHFRVKNWPKNHEHGTHRTGLDLDVRYVMKTDWGEESHRLSLGDSNYDREATRELIKQFILSGAENIYVHPNGWAKIIDSDSETLTYTVDGKSYSATVQRLIMHENHFHVTYPFDGGPALGQEGLFTPSSLTLVAGDPTEVVITTDVVRDTRGSVLLQGQPIYVTVRDSANNVRGAIEHTKFYRDTKNVRYYVTDANGILTINYKPSAFAGSATLTLWADRYKTRKIASLPIIFTPPKQ